jgi:hypothetical protein
VFDTGLQHERTSLAWERTAISMMVAGLVLSRFAATEDFWLLAAAGMAQVVFGAVVLVWSGAHYEDLHGALRSGTDVVHPSRRPLDRHRHDRRHRRGAGRGDHDRLLGLIPSAPPVDGRCSIASPDMTVALPRIIDAGSVVASRWAQSSPLPPWAPSSPLTTPLRTRS